MTKRWILYSFVIWRVCVFICLNNTILTLLFFFSKIMIAEEMECFEGLSWWSSG